MSDQLTLDVPNVDADPLADLNFDDIEARLDALDGVAVDFLPPPAP